MFYNFLWNSLLSTPYVNQYQNPLQPPYSPAASISPQLPYPPSAPAFPRSSHPLYSPYPLYPLLSPRLLRLDGTGWHTASISFTNFFLSSFLRSFENGYTHSLSNLLWWQGIVNFNRQIYQSCQQPFLTFASKSCWPLLWSQWTI